MVEPAAATVVMAVLDGGPPLRHQLEALAAQRPDRPWEVIVADNGSTDGSVALAETFRARLPISVVDASTARGQGHARNVGASHGSGQYLLFVDQDDVVDEGYVEAMVSALERSPLVAARIATTGINDTRSTGSRLMAQERGLGAGFGLLPYAAGGTLGVRRPVFELVGGFDPSMPGAAEDVDLCWRVQLATGERMQFVPDAVLHYRLRTGLGAVLRQGRGHGRAEVALRRRYRSLGVAARSRGRARHLSGLAVRAVGRRRRSDVMRLAWAAGHLAGTVEARMGKGGL